jgi:hypothetical protein
MEHASNAAPGSQMGRAASHFDGPKATLKRPPGFGPESTCLRLLLLRLDHDRDDRDQIGLARVMHPDILIAVGRLLSEIAPNCPRRDIGIEAALATSSSKTQPDQARRDRRAPASRLQGYRKPGDGERGVDKGSPQIKQ